MRKTFYFIAGGALASLSIPAIAQDVSADAASDESVTAEADLGLSAEQQASYDSWPDELQGQFDAWPAEVQTYYWSLTPERRELFWRVSDTNKLTLSGLPSEQQAQAWWHRAQVNRWRSPIRRPIWTPTPPIRCSRVVNYPARRSSEIFALPVFRSATSSSVRMALASFAPVSSATHVADPIQPSRVRRSSAT